MLFYQHATGGHLSGALSAACTKQMFGIVTKLRSVVSDVTVNNTRRCKDSHSDSLQ